MKTAILVTLGVVLFYIAVVNGTEVSDAIPVHEVVSLLQ